MIYILRFFIKIVLIRVPDLKIDYCTFFSSPEFLHFDFLSGDVGGTTFFLRFVGETSLVG